MEMYNQIVLNGYIYEHQDCTSMTVDSSYCQVNKHCIRYTCSNGNDILMNILSLMDFMSMENSEKIYVDIDRELSNQYKLDVYDEIILSVNIETILNSIYTYNECFFKDDADHCLGRNDETNKQWNDLIKLSPSLTFPVTIHHIVDPSFYHQSIHSYKNIYISPGSLIEAINNYLDESLLFSSDSIIRFPSFKRNDMNKMNYINHYSEKIGILLSSTTRYSIYTSSNYKEMLAKGNEICNEIAYTVGLDQIECQLPLINKMESISISSVYLQLIVDFLFILFFFISTLYIYSNTRLSYNRQYSTVLTQELIGGNSLRINYLIYFPSILLSLLGTIMGCILGFISLF